MDHVGFIAMADGTAADYAFLEKQEHEYAKLLPSRIMDSLEKLEHSIGGYQVSRLEHSLQSATRALNDGQSTDYIVAALIHDIGDELAPYSHSEMVAAILRPYVSAKIYWIIKHHGIFQMYYYAHHTGGDRNARDRFRDHQWFDACAEFCEKYDQNCFDPNFESKPLSFFAPLVEEVFSREPMMDEAG
ncbi:MAG: HD domain-containing protein [Gammaproteobacteria bacterium]|nr:HD domain-containing protein [Gammaproteobacteria bacterium]